MQPFVPSFTCSHCGETKSSSVFANQTGVFVPCSCEESKVAWEREHREHVERRKRANRRNRKK